MKFILFVVFILSAFLSLTVLPLALLFSVVGLIIVFIILVRKNINLDKTNFFDNSPVLIQSGLILIFTPVITVSIVATVMAGLFS